MAKAVGVFVVEKSKRLHYNYSVYKILRFSSPQEWYEIFT